MMMDTLRNSRANKKKQARKELIKKVGYYIGCGFLTVFVAVACWFMMCVAFIADQGVM